MADKIIHNEVDPVAIRIATNLGNIYNDIVDNPTNIKPAGYARGLALYQQRDGIIGLLTKKGVPDEKINEVLKLLKGKGKQEELDWAQSRLDKYNTLGDQVKIEKYQKIIRYINR